MVVPVYNVEMYLRRCVDSILAQTFKELEVPLHFPAAHPSCQNIYRYSRPQRPAKPKPSAPHTPEMYLRRCVDSILAQTFKELEVILVDDGSGDGSGAICDAYEKSDGRVRVIHKPNGGLTSAWKAGVEAAASRSSLS